MFSWCIIVHLDIEGLLIKKSRWHDAGSYSRSLTALLGSYVGRKVLPGKVGWSFSRHSGFRPLLSCNRLDMSVFITKTRLYNFDPLKPHFYMVKLGFTGVYIIFLLISAQKNVDCGYALESPRRGGSNKYPQSMFWAEIWKISVFYLKSFSF